MTRREVLSGAMALGVASALGVSTFASRPAAASSHVTETIYLSHSVDAENVTKLFSVDLQGSTSEAALTLVTAVGGHFQDVDAIAATPDGAKVMFVDRNTKHLGEYVVATDSFTDLGQINGLPPVTVLSAYGLDGNLYAASNTTNKLYTIDTASSPPVANEVGTITGATVNGADIAFDSQGTLFMHSNNDDTLYILDYQNVVNGNIAANAVGTDAGSSLTGLAIRDAGQSDFLVGSSRTDDAIVLLDKTNGQRTNDFAMTLNGNPYSYTNGDMTVGTLVDETCAECTFDETVKFEYVYEEDEDGTVDVDGFYPEDAVGFDDISYGNTADSYYISKDNEDYEPITVVFNSDVCPDSLTATVKAGRAVHEVDVTAGDEDGTIEVSIDGDGRFEHPRNGNPYAISYIEFSCI